MKENTRKPVTPEEYLVYKAIKDRVPILGYETPSKQFNVMAKVGYIGEAISTVIGDNKGANHLIKALHDFELEAKVKKDLEERVIVEIIHLGKEERIEGSGFGSSLEIYYEPTPELLEAASKCKDIPKVVEEVSKFFLCGKHSLLSEYNKRDRYIKSDHLNAGIELLLGIDKSVSEIALEVKEAIKGRHGAFNTIERYVDGIVSNTSLQYISNKEIPNVLNSVLHELLTPGLFDDALNEIKLTKTYYANLNEIRAYVDSGKCESEINNFANNKNNDLYPWNFQERIDHEIKGEVNKAVKEVKYFNKYNISPIVAALKGLESNLGEEKFAEKGYSVVLEKTNNLISEVDETSKYIVKQLYIIKEKLIKEKEAESKKPWYKKFYEIK